MSEVFAPSPSEEEDALREVGDREVELLMESLKGVHDDGYIIFGPSKPAAQLFAYMTETLEEERMMLLDPDYLQKLDAGLVPAPVNPVWYLIGPDGKAVRRPSSTPGFPITPFATQEEAVQWGEIIGLITPEMLQPQVDQMGQPIPPQLPVQSEPSFWALIVGLPRTEDDGPFFWEQRDFVRLLEAYGRRMEAAT